MKFMPLFPDKFWNIGIPDPPYNLGQNLKKVKSREKLAATAIKEDFTWDKAIPSDEYFAELRRVTANQIIWGANYFPAICGLPFKAPRRHEFKSFLQEHPENWIIWDKVNGTNDFSDCELAWTSFPAPSRIFRFMWNGMCQGVSIDRGLVMQGNKARNEKRVHPTQKPLALSQWMLREYARSGDKILDTHMGSQRSRIAAYKMGFDYWGCEIDKKHYYDGCNRFNNLVYEPLFSK